MVSLTRAPQIKVSERDYQSIASHTQHYLLDVVRMASRKAGGEDRVIGMIESLNQEFINAHKNGIQPKQIFEVLSEHQTLSMALVPFLGRDYSSSEESPLMPKPIDN